jgi:hypothetical protein
MGTQIAHCLATMGDTDIQTARQYHKPKKLGDTQTAGELMLYLRSSGKN